MWKTRGSVPRSDSLEKLANYLNVSQSYLLGLSDDQTPEVHVQKPYETSKGRLIPVFTGIPDSDDIFSEYKYMQDEIFCSDNLKNLDYLFAIVASSNSMTPIIDVGDLIIAQYTEGCESGDMVIYKIFGDIGVRWYQQDENGIALFAENAFDKDTNPSGFKPIIIGNDQFDQFDFSIIGKVYEVRKSHRNLYKASLIQ